MNNWPVWDDNRIRLLSPFEHKERVDDDCGLPEHPIYSNFSKYLWKGHKRSGGVQVTDASVHTTKRRTNE